MATFFLLALCFCLGWSIRETINAFHDDKLYAKLIGIITSCLLGFLIVITHYASQENLKHQVMEDYLNGKIEIIEQIDTIRTFKFN